MEPECGNIVGITWTLIQPVKIDKDLQTCGRANEDPRIVNMIRFVTMAVTIVQL